MKEHIRYNVPLYLAMASTCADGASATFLGLNISEGNLEKSLIWGAVTLINTASVIGNYIISKK